MQHDWKHVERPGKSHTGVGRKKKLQYSFLRLGYFVTGRYCTTIQYTANLAELAYGRIKVIDPLGWDVFQKFGGIIDFAGSDLAEGQLGNGLCKAMDSGILDRSRSFHPKG